jgi:hypothetical protein
MRLLNRSVSITPVSNSVSLEAFPYDVPKFSSAPDPAQRARRAEGESGDLFSDPDFSHKGIRKFRGWVLFRFVKAFSSHA